MYPRSVPSLILLLSSMLQAATPGHAQDNAADVAARISVPPAGIRVAAVGDIMMGTTFPEEILPPEDGATLFRAVLPLLSGHDIVFGNLEGALTDVEKSPKCPDRARQDGRRCFAFRTPPRYVEHLRTAGFNALNVANNHSLDFGMDGLDNTLAALDNAGIQAVGGERVATFTEAGKRVAIAGFSYSLLTRYVHPLLDLDRAREIVAGLKAANDVVVVSFHGGAEGKAALRVADSDEEFLGEKRGNVVRFARAAVDAGADLVLGHGPHVPRALEVYRGKLIAYSLGNFATYSMFNLREESGISYILQAELSPETGDVVRFRTPSVALRDLGIPRPDPSGRAEELLRNLSEEFLSGEPDAAERRETLSRLWH